MNKSTFQFIRQASKSSFATSLLLALLTSTPSPASQKATPSAIALLGSGVAVYLGTKASALKNQSHTDGVAEKGQPNKRLALVPSLTHKREKQGKKLVKLYITNHKLSQSVTNQLGWAHMHYQQDGQGLDLAEYTVRPTAHKCNSLVSPPFSKASKSGSLKKVITALCLLSAIPGAEAGPATCAACTTGACAASLPLGPVAFGLCVVEASATICSFFCLAPLP